MKIRPVIMKCLFNLSLLQLLILCSPLTYSAEKLFKSEQTDFVVETMVTGLSHPWGMCFLPDGNLLVTERGGKLLRINMQSGSVEQISGLPDIAVVGQGGLLDVVLDTDYKNNYVIYMSFAAKGQGGYGTEVIRGKLTGSKFTDPTIIFRALPKQDATYHFGSRLQFAGDGTLFISLGDRGDRPNGQDSRTHAGSLIRINPDGTVPGDNPFVDKQGYLPEIYTIGNRNMQGMTVQPGTNLLWTNEHGPQGGDELNIMRPGNNYGWPVITYGKNYVIGTNIGEGTHKSGMEQPVHYWVPSIGPSGMTFYSGSEFPEWDGDLFISSLIFGLLVRIEVENNEVVHEERLLHGSFGRIRDVEQGPDGMLYLLTDNNNGKLIRIRKP